MLKNSIIAAYRNRKMCLHVFLRTLFLASEKTSHNHEIIVCDLNSTDGSDSVFHFYEKRMNLKWLKINYNGPFWKTKALNCCVKNSTGDLITMLDIDSVVLPNFLLYIDNFFSDQNMWKYKLAHRVMFLNDKTTQMLFKQLDNIKIIARIIEQLHGVKYET